MKPQLHYRASEWCHIELPFRYVKDHVGVRVAAVEEAGHLGHWVSPRRLQSRSWQAHHDQPGRDIRQVQIVAVGDGAVAVAGDGGAEEVGHSSWSGSSTKT